MKNILLVCLLLLSVSSFAHTNKEFNLKKADTVITNIFKNIESVNGGKYLKVTGFGYQACVNDCNANAVNNCIARGGNPAVCAGTAVEVCIQVCNLTYNGGYL